jgi:hypothetical protein
MVQRRAMHFFEPQSFALQEPLDRIVRDLHATPRELVPHPCTARQGGKPGRFVLFAESVMMLRYRRGIDRQRRKGFANDLLDAAV